jgi:heat shock protein HslJ
LISLFVLRLGILGLGVRKKRNLQKKKISLFPSNYYVCCHKTNPMQNFLILLLLASVLVLVACKAKKTANEVAPEDSTSAPLDVRLHDIWVLTTINGEELDRTKARPRLELYPKEGRISGNGGCNELFGQMDGMGKEITFRNVGTTKMFCRDIMELENNFLTLLQQAQTYRIKDLKLYLFEGKKEILVFQKVD